MKKLSLYIFLVLMFSLFTSYSFAEKKHKIYKRLPCSFNGVKVGPSAIPYEDRKVRKNRCCPGCKGYKGKIGTSINAKSKKPGIPVVAITNMTLYTTRNLSIEYGCQANNLSRWKGFGNVTIIHPLTGKKEKCSHPFDNVSLYFKDDKYGNIIRYYHLMSTPMVPGFNKGKCKNPKFENERYFLTNPEDCDDIKYTKVKKGEVIGKMGYAGNAHFSLGIGPRGNEGKLGKLKDTKECKGVYKSMTCYGVSPAYLIAPEDRFEWENLPTDSDAYLFPVMSKKYLKKIGYYK